MSEKKNKIVKYVKLGNICVKFFDFELKDVVGQSAKANCCLYAKFRKEKCADGEKLTR